MIVQAIVSALQVPVDDHQTIARTTFHGQARIVQRVLKEEMIAQEVADQF